MKINLNVYKDKSGYGVRICHGNDISKEFISFIREFKNITFNSKRIDKNGNFIWLTRKDMFQELCEIYKLRNLLMEINKK